MKTTIYFFVSLFVLSLLSCTQSKDEQAKEAVRQYLKKKGVTEYTELQWGKLDSVFSPFNVDLSFDIKKSIINKDISQLEFLISELNFNPRKNKERIKILRDSISLLTDSLSSVYKTYNEIIDQRINNRIGISLKLSYKTLIGSEKTAKYTFVFESNPDELSVGHHLDEFGFVCK